MNNNSIRLSGQIVDVVNSRIYRGTLEIEDGRIVDIYDSDNDDNLIIMPGFIDSHIHIESSLLVPTEFARLAVIHGSIATVSDPHEIANVLGLEGVQYMIETGKKSPFKFHFCAPSCVPATTFESSGGTVNSDDIDTLMSMDEIICLGEMMNYPGVIFNDEEVARKLESARRHNKPIDGHAPLLNGEDLKKYRNAGISTDHECYTLDEAREKAELGMTIQIRKGSAANNFNSLIPLIEEYPDNIMFCTDDTHPHELIKSHINGMVKEAIHSGYNILDVIKAATLTPVKHYNLNVGLLQKNDPADFIIIDNFDDFNILKTYINGELVAENGKSLLQSVPVKTINKFVADKVTAKDFEVIDEGKDVKIIGVVSGGLITEKIIGRPKVIDKNMVSDIDNDILKIAVINRYENKRPAVGFIKNFGLKRGALASSVAHDSHNIIVIGCSDESMAAAGNMIIDNKGGLAVYDDEIKMCLPLPIAGIMSKDDAFKVAGEYQKIKDLAKRLGSPLSDPFMTMEFMALLVIPKLKLSDKGLFDCEKFELTSIFVDK